MRLLILGIATWAALGTWMSKSPVFAYYIGAHLMTTGIFWLAFRRLEKRYGG